MKDIDTLTHYLIKSMSELDKDNPAMIMFKTRELVQTIYNAGIQSGLSVFKAFTDEHIN